MAKTSLKDTTVGRAILWMIVRKVCLTPSSTRRWVKKQSPNAEHLLPHSWSETDCYFCGPVMYTGFAYAARSGASVGIDDWSSRRRNTKSSPRQKQKLLNSGAVPVWSGNCGRTLQQSYHIWAAANDRVSKAMMDNLQTKPLLTVTVRKRSRFPSTASTDGRLRCAWFCGTDSSACWYGGLMAKPDGSIIETPITANFVKV